MTVSEYSRFITNLIRVMSIVTVIKIFWFYIFLFLKMTDFNVTKSNT